MAMDEHSHCRPLQQGKLLGEGQVTQPEVQVHLPFGEE